MKILHSFLILLQIIWSSDTSETVYVNSSKELKEQLDRLSNGERSLSIELDSSVEYSLSGKNFIYLENVTLSMKGGNTSSANISCASKAMLPNRPYLTIGIVIVNSDITFAQLSFKFCGKSLQNLPSNITDTLNTSSPLYYSSTQAGALIFIHCRVNMDSVKIESSYGFAVIGYNLKTSHFQHLDICNSYQRHEHHRTSTGSGMILHFSDSQTPMVNSTHISIFSSSFENNIELFNGSELCISDTFTLRPNASSYPLMNAVALTIAYTQSNYTAKVNVNETKFLNNIGVQAGALMITVLHHGDLSTTKLVNSEFKGNALYNKSRCLGVALQFFWFGRLDSSHFAAERFLVIDNTVFNGSMLKQGEYHSIGAVFIGIYCPNVKASLDLRKLYFIENSNLRVKGNCIFAKLNKHFGNKSIITVVLTSIIVIKNSELNKRESPTSELYFENIWQVAFHGIGHFENNFGSVIYSVESNLYLHDNMTFINNTGENGGAIRMEGNCLLYFMPGVNALFRDNEAYMYGGAIYAISSSYIKCAIQVENPTSVRISFTNNLAKIAGNSIFAARIMQCEINGSYHDNVKLIYSKYFNLSRVDRELSTYPLYMFADVIHNDKYLRFGAHSLTLYPGEMFTLMFFTYDLSGEEVFSHVNTEVFDSNRYKPAVLWLKQQSMNKIIEDLYRRTNLSIHTQTETPNVINAVLTHSVPGVLSKSHTIQLQPCPKGFSLYKPTGSCECSNIFRILQGTKCLINERKIVLSHSYTNAWIGELNSDKKIAIFFNCPITYCKSFLYNKEIKFTEDGVLLIYKKNKTIPFCNNNRVGVLCGQCNKTGNYSMVFGSTKCKKCSNLWLITILIYMLAGPLLIYLLYTFKLTLTAGTLNGILFYAHAANAGLLQSMSQLYYGENTVIIKIYQICSVVLLFLNLNLGFPLCFYNGMNQLWKTGLSLIFPLYLLTIVVFIIVISRYSTWLSNRTSHSSVQVLVTVVHLSFSKLLIILIDVFTPATIHTEDRNYHVWYWDGSVEYMGHSHYKLVIITIVVVTILVLPYITLLIVAKPLIRCNRLANLYLRPIIEAIHAPFRRNKEYWFVARILLLIVLYVTYAVLRNNSTYVLHMVTAFLLAIFLYGQMLFPPYRKKSLNLLDSWLMFNITLVYAMMSNDISFILKMVGIGLAVLTFGIILVYHILSTLKCVKRLESKLLNKLSFISFQAEATQCNVQLLKTDSYYESCDGYREPLLSQQKYN